MLEALRHLEPFQGRSQRSILRHGCQHSEEKDYFIETARRLAEIIATMPTTGQQDGKGKEAIAYLHYFTGGMDWFITEKDIDSDHEGQHQAFGLVHFSGNEPELGYISLVELANTNKVELDWHFQPATLGAIRQKLEAA